MKKFKINKKQKFRALLSDVLPYELPIIFSNKGFCDFVQMYRIYLSHDFLLKSRDKESWIQCLLDIINGSNNSRQHKQSYVYKIWRGSKVLEPSKENHLNDSNGQEKITELKPIIDRNRLLTIPHPYYQFRIASLYNQYAPFIIYLASRSKFSIRYPANVSSFQAMPRPEMIKGVIIDEKNDTNSELSHYFVYKHYQNINGFYEDYRFQRAERKFNLMIRTDIKKCFDFVQPERLFEAVYGSDVSRKAKDGFVSEFVNLQREMFAGKLNVDDDENESILKDNEVGVLIGPEFSRIFVELIIQAVDRRLEEEFEKEKLYFGRDYEFYRYVDDGFFFCNNTKTGSMFLAVYSDILAKWGLAINEKKVQKYYSHPFLDDLTIAKIKLKQLVVEMFKNRTETIDGVIKLEKGKFVDPFVLNLKTSIRNFQCIVKEYGCKYSDVTSYLLSNANREMINYAFKGFYRIYKLYFEANELGDIDDRGTSEYRKLEAGFIRFAKEVVSFLFFVFSCDPRMSTSIKVVQIITDLVNYVDGKLEVELKDNKRQFKRTSSLDLKRHISDELIMLVKSQGKMCLEIANLLLLYHRIPIQLCPSEKKMTQFIQIEENMNFMCVFTLEHIMGRKYANSVIHTNIQKWILDKMLHIGNKNTAEYVYILVNSLTCPYFEDEFKEQICKLAGLGETSSDALIKNSYKFKNIFVDWRYNKMLTMLRQKVNSQVY